MEDQLCRLVSAPARDLCWEQLLCAWFSCLVLAWQRRTGRPETPASAMPVVVRFLAD